MTKAKDRCERCHQKAETTPLPYLELQNKHYHIIQACQKCADKETNKPRRRRIYTILGRRIW